MNRQALYGLISGLFFSSWVLAEYYMGWFQTPFHTLIRFFPVAGIFIIMGILRKRSEAGELFTTAQGFKAGMATGIIYLLIASVAMYICYKYVNTEFVQHTYEQTLNNLLKKGTEASKAKELATPILSKMPQEAALYSVIIHLPLTLVLSLAAAFVLRKKPA
jgi:hypothetical protein